jgi:glutathione S-transferase
MRAQPGIQFGRPPGHAQTEAPRRLAKWGHDHLVVGQTIGEQEVCGQASARHQQILNAFSHRMPQAKLRASLDGSAGMLKLYGDAVSGNCYKVQLLLAQLGIDYDWQSVDVLSGEARTPEFRAMNPNGKVPVLELAPGSYLWESNAILCHLAEGTAFWSGDSVARARVLQWLFFEQYSHEPYIAVARFIVRYLGRPENQLARLAGTVKPGHAALAVMERHLAGQRFFSGPSYGIADIALYAYTHVAHEGEFDLGGYPAILDWLSRVREQPGHVPMGLPG